MEEEEEAMLSVAAVDTTEAVAAPVAAAGVGPLLVALSGPRLLPGRGLLSRHQRRLPPQGTTTPNLLRPLGYQAQG